MSAGGDGHGHGHSCGSEHDGTDDSNEMGVQYSLYQKIDRDRLECLNESEEGSGKAVFKPWDQRLTKEQFVESDVDEELLFNIPFTGNVKLKGIVIIGGEDGSHPATMRLFKNRPSMTFDDANISPEQEFELHPDPTGQLEYSTKVVTFSSTHHLTIHFPRNFGSEVTRLYYIGLRGEFSEAHRHGVTLCTYEARPNVFDHKGNVFDHVSKEIQ